jgi:hypothetical protein
MALYEIHLTVEGTEQVEHFQNVCHVLGLKPLLLNLHFYPSYMKEDIPNMMTSSVFEGNFVSAVDYSLSLQKRIDTHGFKVLRRKLETPYSSSEDSEEDIRPSYFEAHQKITLKDETSEHMWSIIRDKIPEQLPFTNPSREYKLKIPHFSSNSLRSDKGNRSKMVTWRRANMLTAGHHWPGVMDLSIYEFQHYMDSHFGNILDLGVVKRECVVFDSNKSVDLAWAPF